MAINSKNKYPADKTGTKYSEFRNTKRTPPGKSRSEAEGKQGGGSTSRTQAKTA